MKLLLVTPYFYPKVGGLENYAYNIGKRLHEEYGWDVVVITSNHKENKYKEEVINYLKIYRLPYWFKISNTPINPLWFFQIRKIIQKEKPNIINSHSPVPFIADITAIVCKDIPYILTYHAGTLYKKNNFLANCIIFFYSYFERYTKNKAKIIIAVSDYVKQILAKKYNNKIYVINNSISKNEIICKKIQMGRNLIFIGSLDKTHVWKGLDDIIEAIKIYTESFDKNIHLNIIGSGDYGYFYKNKVHNLNLDKYITFISKKTGREKNECLQKTSILLTYPTTANDAFPTVFLEAWAKRVPIISSNIGAIPSIITHKRNGILVEPHSPNKLANTIKELLSSKILQDRLIVNGIKTLENNCLWETNIKKFNDILIKTVRN